MTVVRYEPWNFMNRLHRDLNQLLNDAPDSGAGPRAVAVVPRVDVHDEPQRYLLQADLPGVQPADIEVTTDDGVLSLRAERRAGSSETHEKGTTRIERSQGLYQRRFTLPDDADLEAIEARYAHGVLELVIPKHAKAQPRRVAVQAA